MGRLYLDSTVSWRLQSEVHRTLLPWRRTRCDGRNVSKCLLGERTETDLMAQLEQFAQGGHDSTGSKVVLIFAQKCFLWPLHRDIIVNRSGERWNLVYQS
jgi:hypothetical protein